MESKSILIADDDEQISNVLSMMLQREGYKVFPASNGREAVKVAQNNTVHVALLDIEMPVMNGIEAMKGIKKANESTEVLIVTGHADLENLRETIDDLGAFDYIVKPFHRTDVLNSVRNAFLKRDSVFHDSSIKEEPDDKIVRLEKDFEERTRQLRESQVKYREIVESSNDIILVVQDGKIKFANTKIVELTGFIQEEILCSPFVKIVFPEDRKIIEETYLGQLERKDPSTMLSFRMLNKFGEPFWVEGNSKRTIWEERPAVLAFMRDINERKQAEEALRASEERFRNLAEDAPFGLSIMKPDKTFEYFNPKFTDIFGYTIEDIPDKQVWFEKAYPNEEYRKEVISAWEEDTVKSDKIEETKQRAFTVRCKDGQDKIIHFMNVALKDEKQFLTYEDITAQTKAEESLQQNEEKYRNLVEESFDGIFVQKGLKIIFANERLHEMLGYDEGELLSLDHWLVYHPDYQELTRQRAQARMQKKMVTSQYEVKLLRKDGSSFDGEINARAINFDGEPGVQVWVRDISERKQAEKRLKDSEEKYRTIFEDSRDAIYVNRDGKYTDVNQSMLDLFGYTTQEMIGMKAEKTYAHPDERERAVKEMKKKGSLRDYEIKFKKKDGREMDCLATASAIRADDGKIVGYQGIIRDITEQNRVKAALERERQQFFSMFDGMDEVVYVADPNTYEMLYMNAPAKKHWGDGVEQKCYSVLQNLNSPCSFCTNDRIFGENAIATYIWEFQNTINHRRYRCIDKAIHWPDGRMVRFEMAIDITEWKETQESLKESESKYKELVQSANSIIVYLDTQGRFTLFNKFAQEFFGYAEDEIIGKHIIGTIVPEKDSSGHDLVNLTQDIIRYPERHLYNENENIRKNGDRVWVAWTNKTIYDAKGHPTGVLCIGTDITERKQAQEELTKSNEQLEQAIVQANQMAVEAQVANMAKSEFLANMSHEIRTPMNGVLGFADMLLDTNLDENQADYARTIKRSGESLLSLINDILDLSKIEAEKLDFEEIDFDPELLAYDVCELIRPKIESKPIEVLCRIGDNVPSMVKGDPTRYRQVLTNLLENAPKFTESGEIELTLDIEEVKDDRVKLHAKIRDTGIGIPKDKLSTIFEPFQQADGSTTRKYGGTGLGLSLCKKISELMGGEVWAERPSDCRLTIDDCLLKDNSKDKKNSQSSIVNRQYDPATSNEQPATSNQQRPTSIPPLNNSTTQRLNQMPGSVFHFTAWLGKTEKKEARTYTPADLSKKKVLIVDDNRNNLEILTHFLESVEMRVHGLTSGEEVVPALQKALEDGNPFDLCISDIRMPDMDGYEVAKQIRNFKSSIVNRQSSIRSIPLLALSSSTKRDAKKCEEAGFDGFLSKPIRKEKLYKMLEKLIGDGAESKGQRVERKEKKIATQYSVKEEMKHSVRILIVEDNPVNQKLAKMMLTKAGYQVEVANNGKEAVDKYTQSPNDFDLIIMDIQMPEMDGLEATRAIRKREEEIWNQGDKARGGQSAGKKLETGNWKLNNSATQQLNHLPIIALTANAMQGDREMCLEAGMDDYMTKPIKRELVFEMIKKWVLES